MAAVARSAGRASQGAAKAGKSRIHRAAELEPVTAFSPGSVSAIWEGGTNPPSRGATPTVSKPRVAPASSKALTLRTATAPPPATDA